MTSLRFGVCGFMACSALLTMGCNSEDNNAPSPRPIDSTEATSTMNTRLDELVVSLGDSTGRLDMTGSTGVATRSVNQAAGSSSACSGSSGGGSSDSEGIDDVPGSTSKDLDELLHRVAQEAKDHVFREEFVELRDGNQVVYRVDAGSACGSDTTCLEKLSNHPIRFAVTANTDDNLNVSLLVGQAQINPGTAVLGSSKLSMRLNLAHALEALRLYVDADDQKDLPDRLAGVVEGAIEKRAENHFVISGSVIEKFDLLVGQAKNKPVAVTVLPTAPTTQLTIDASSNTLGYALNLGAVDVQLAGAAVCSDKCGTKEKTGTFVGHLAGVTGAVTMTKDAQELTFSGLGLGNDTSNVKLNNDHLGTLDVNPKHGRKLSMTFKKTAEGTLVTFDPAFDIKLAIMLNKLSESLRVDMPGWLEDEIFEVMFGGGAKPSILIPAPTCDANGEITSKSQVKVVSGNLTLSSRSLASPVEATAGMCLVPVDGSDSDAHPFSQVKAGVCQ